MTGQVPEAQPKAGRFRPGSYAMLLCAATLLVMSTTARAATPGQQQVTRDFQKTLSLPSGQSFRIENKFGEIRIHGESSREVKISATIRTQATLMSKPKVSPTKSKLKSSKRLRASRCAHNTRKTPAIGSGAKTLPILLIMTSPFLPMRHSW